MKGHTARQIDPNELAAAMWQPTPDATPSYTAQQRLHQNVQRLQALEQQLLSDELNQTELLTAIELVGFKIRHLARQMQQAGQMELTGSQSTSQSAAPVC